MHTLIPLSDSLQDANSTGTGTGLVGQRAYGTDGDHLGTVKEVLGEENGKIRYLVIDAGGWFSSKMVVIPVGLARVEDDGVYFDTLTKDQVNQMSGYDESQEYTDEAQVSDIRTLRGNEYVPPVETAERTLTAADHYDDAALFTTPTRLQLLEERLQVNKEKVQAGSVSVGKHVETHTESVSVPLTHEEIVIERHAVTDAQPVSGQAVLGADTQTIRVDLEAERANVAKQAYVTEEVEVGKRTETEQQTYSETVGREVLDVTRTGETTAGQDATSMGQQTTQRTVASDDRRTVDRTTVDALEKDLDNR